MSNLLFFKNFIHQKIENKKKRACALFFLYHISTTIVFRKYNPSRTKIE